MTKNEFLTALANRLLSLPRDDAQKSVDYYSEMIDERIEEGLSEDEATKAVGSIDDIASLILSETQVEDTSKNAIGNNEISATPKRKLKTYELVLIIAGSPIWAPILLALIIVAFALFIVIWAVIISCFAATLSFGAGTLSGIVAFISMMLSGLVAQGFIFIGVSLILAGLCILSFIGSVELSKLTIKLTQRLLSKIKSIFSKGVDIQ